MFIVLLCVHCLFCSCGLNVIVFFITVMDHLMSPLDWIGGCPDFWLTATSGFQMGLASELPDPAKLFSPLMWAAPCYLLADWMEQKGAGRKSRPLLPDCLSWGICVLLSPLLGLRRQAGLDSTSAAPLVLRPLDSAFTVPPALPALQLPAADRGASQPRCLCEPTSRTDFSSAEISLGLFLQRTPTNTITQ